MPQNFIQGPLLLTLLLMIFCQIYTVKLHRNSTILWFESNESRFSEISTTITKAHQSHLKSHIFLPYLTSIILFNRMKLYRLILLPPQIECGLYVHLNEIKHPGLFRQVSCRWTLYMHLCWIQNMFEIKSIFLTATICSNCFIVSQVWLDTTFPKQIYFLKLHKYANTYCDNWTMVINKAFDSFYMSNIYVHRPEPWALCVFIGCHMRYTICIER